MPEIGEVARIVNRLKKHLVGRVISQVQVTEDTKVFHNPTTAEMFRKAMTGKKVVDVKQWGKYFWLVMESPPHPVMHFGMTGWIHIKSDPSAHYRPMKSESLKKPDSNSKARDSDEESNPELSEWPPRLWKFNLKLGSNDNEIAFTDTRRLGRIRLIDEKDGNNLRNVLPISANGPDPAQEPDSVTEEWLRSKLKSKKVPIKAFLLDQAILAGIGNWVGDEILYEAKLHPEAYTNTLSDEQMKVLHESILYVTKTAVELEAEQNLFPEHWLMKHRWNKGKNNEAGEGKLPNGEMIAFLTVGGRTSAYVPSIQKKGFLNKIEVGNANGKTQKVGEKRVRKKTMNESEETAEEEVGQKQQVGRKRRVIKDEVEEEAERRPKRHISTKGVRTKLETKIITEESQEGPENDVDSLPPKMAARSLARLTARVNPTVKKTANDKTSTRKRPRRLRG